MIAALFIVTLITGVVIGYKRGITRVSAVHAYLRRITLSNG